MKQKKQILVVSCVILLMAYTAPALAQDMEMVDLFDEVNEQIQGSTSVITTIMYAIAAILLLIGAGLTIPKIIKGQDVGKEVGGWFLGAAFFVLAAYLSSTLIS